MSRFFWRLVEVLGYLLDPAEREIVRGDFAESGTSGPAALREVLGLVARRQVGLWRHWQPWLAVLALVIPVGTMLSAVSSFWAAVTANYTFWYVNHWTWTILQIPGARNQLAHFCASFLLNCITLMAWSWISGFTVGRLSRQAVWVTGALLCVVVVSGPWGSALAAERHAALSSTANSLVFPAILRIALVLFPAVSGMRQGLAPASLRITSAIVGGATAIILTALAARDLEWSLLAQWARLFGVHALPPLAGPDGAIGTGDDLRPLRLLPLVMLWPVVYMIATAAFSRRSKHASA